MTQQKKNNLEEKKSYQTIQIEKYEFFTSKGKYGKKRPQGSSPKSLVMIKSVKTWIFPYTRKNGS